MTPQELSVLRKLVRDQDYEHYLCSLFAPALHRTALWAALALTHELLRIPTLATEPMAGLVRLKWWQEQLEQHASPAHMSSEHPVLTTLAPFLQTDAIPLTTCQTLCDCIATQMTDAPPFPHTVAATMTETYRLLGCVSGEQSQSELYADMGRTYGMLAAIRTRYDTSAITSVDLHAALEEIPPFTLPPRASRFLTALCCLNRLWERQIRRADGKKGSLPPRLPLLPLRLLLTDRSPNRF